MRGVLQGEAFNEGRCVAARLERFLRRGGTPRGAKPDRGDDGLETSGSSTVTVSKRTSTSRS